MLNQKNIQLTSLNSTIQQNEIKLSSLQSQIKQIQQTKLNNNQELESIKQSLQTFNSTLIDKQNKCKDIEQEIELKLKQLHDLNKDFDEQSQKLRESRNSLQRVHIDIDEKNNELQGIVKRINVAKIEIDEAQRQTGSTRTSSPKPSQSLNFDTNVQLSMLSNISSPENARANSMEREMNERNEQKDPSLLTVPLDLSLEEINKTALKSINDQSEDNIMATNSPQIIIQLVENLRRTIDAMCYPRGGCIFSLASAIQHYNSALNTLEQKDLD